jgi:hypothetical protein
MSAIGLHRVFEGIETAARDDIVDRESGRAHSRQCPVTAAASCEGRLSTHFSRPANNSDGQLSARDQSFSGANQIAPAEAICDGSLTTSLSACRDAYRCFLTTYRESGIFLHDLQQEIHDCPYLRRPAQVPMNCQPDISRKRFAVVCNTLQLRIGIRQEAW